MSDSFEDAVAGVNTQAPSSGSSEIVREKIVYPAAPPGLYRAMCIAADEKEFKNFEGSGTELKYSLRFELRTNVMTNLPVTYKGSDDKEHKFSLWGKPLTRNFADGKKNGKPSNLYKLFNELFGIPPPFVKRDEKRMISGHERLVEVIVFDHKLFESSEVIIKVGQKTLDDGRIVNTCEYEGFSCDPEMKLRNYNQLPPQVREKFPFPSALKGALPTSNTTGSAMKPPSTSVPQDSVVGPELIDPAVVMNGMPSTDDDRLAEMKKDEARKAEGLPW